MTVAWRATKFSVSVAAWLALIVKYDGMPNAGRVASYGSFYSSNLRPGQDPDIELYAMDGARDRLHAFMESTSAADGQMSGYRPGCRLEVRRIS